MNLLSTIIARRNFHKVNELMADMQYISDGLVNVRHLGLLGNESNETTTLQNIFNNIPNNSRIVLPNGNFSFDSLTVTNKNGITIQGTSREGSILTLRQSYNKRLEFRGCSNIELRDLTIILEDSSTTDKFRFFVDAQDLGCKNIRIVNCTFKNAVNVKTNSALITFWRNCYNIEISNCRFEDIGVTLKFDNNGVSNDPGFVRLMNNDFMGDVTNRANTAVRFQGSGSRIGTNVMMNMNTFTRYDFECIDLYHVQSYIITGNKFDDCKALVAEDYSGTSPVEQAICWLDTIGTPAGSAIFQGNTFINCVGICIYLEEVKSGLISNNTFLSITKRPSGTKTFSDGVQTIASIGNHCIVVGGGVKDLKITGNIFESVDRAIMICRRFSPSIIGGYYTEDIHITDNKIRCREVAIDIKERTHRPYIAYNHADCINADIHPFLHYDKTTTTQDMSIVMVEGNHVRNFLNLFSRPSNYGNGVFRNNFLFSATGQFFACNFRTQYVIQNNQHATSTSAFTTINS